MKCLFKGFGTRLNMSTIDYLDIDGYIERFNHVIEDMLRIYVMNQPGKWEDYIHLVDFSYNNNYQASLKMIPFEVLYGRRCKVPLSWGNLEHILNLGRDMLAQMEEMVF